MITNADMHTWESPPETVTPPSNEAHLWLFPLDATPDSETYYQKFLPNDELQRAKRFHFQKDRRRFTISHGVLRHILHSYTSKDPRDITFQLNDYGKPFLPQKEIYFNLSHSGEMGLIGVTSKWDVGVDIEHIREDFEFEGIAKRFFSKSENLQLQSIPADKRRSAFFHCWVRKEAYIKARGKGLSIPLEQFSVSVSPNDKRVGLTIHDVSEESSPWMLRALPSPPLYAAAVAVEGDLTSLRLWRYPI